MRYTACQQGWPCSPMNCGYLTRSDLQATQQVRFCRKRHMFTFSTVLISQSTGNGQTHLAFLKCCLHAERLVMNERLGCMCTKCLGLIEQMYARLVVDFADLSPRSVVDVAVCCTFKVVMSSRATHAATVTSRVWQILDDPGLIVPLSTR